MARLGSILSFWSLWSLLSLYYSIIFSMKSHEKPHSVPLNHHLIYLWDSFSVPGHLRGSRLLSFFAFYYENNIVWGGVGWGGIIMSFTLPHICDGCNISVRSLAFHSHPHIRHATFLQILLHFHTYVMLRCRFSCTSTHTSGYAVGTLALPHMCHATLL